MGKEQYSALILDDEFYLGQILAQALEHENIKACAVTDVDSAIDRLNSQSFDIIISDIYLPGKTGKDLFQYALQYYPEIPFIFMTGNPSLEMAVDLLKQGGYDYIVKPFMMEDFVRKTLQVIQKSREVRHEKHLVDDLRDLLNKRLEELRIYQDVFESTGDGLLILDTNGNIVKVNSGFEQMTGLREDQLQDKPFTILEKEIYPDLSFDQIRQDVICNGHYFREVNARRHRGGHWISDISFFTICNEEGKTFAFAALIKDVTAQREVEKALIDSLRRTTQAQEAIIFGLARLAEYRDQDTGFHLERIRTYCKILAEKLSKHKDYSSIITDKFIDTIYHSAPLHDIGKVGIPDYILLKKAKLTEFEFEVMKTHALIGYETLESIRQQYGEMDFLNMGIEITYCHHERYDGKGYPRGISGAEIPLSAHIVAIADVYDALTSHRVYKKAFPHKKALKIMKEQRGKHFNPVLFDQFVEIADQFDAVRQSYLRTPRNQYLAG